MRKPAQKDVTHNTSIISWCGNRCQINVAVRLGKSVRKLTHRRQVKSHNDKTQNTVKYKPQLFICDSHSSHFSLMPSGSYISHHALRCSITVEKPQCCCAQTGWWSITLVRQRRNRKQGEEWGERRKTAVRKKEEFLVAVRWRSPRSDEFSDRCSPGAQTLAGPDGTGRTGDLQPNQPGQSKHQLHAWAEKPQLKKSSAQSRRSSRTTMLQHSPHHGTFFVPHKFSSRNSPYS